MENTVFSIGYSGFVIDDFIEEIQKHNINVIIDVRSQPYSKTFKPYNKDTLSRNLKRFGIYYRNYNVEFGARQNIKQYETPFGFLDFEKFVRSKNFRDGYTKIKNSLDQGYRVCFMCAEKHPINCHRSLMVTREFHKNGYNVEHIMPDGKRISQIDLEGELLEKYMSPHTNSKLAGTNIKDELVNMAYRIANMDIYTK